MIKILYHDYLQAVLQQERIEGACFHNASQGVAHNEHDVKVVVHWSGGHQQKKILCWLGKHHYRAGQSRCDAQCDSAASMSGKPGPHLSLDSGPKNQIQLLWRWVI